MPRAVSAGAKDLHACNCLQSCCGPVPRYPPGSTQRNRRPSKELKWRKFHTRGWLHAWWKGWEVKQETVRQPRDRQEQEAATIYLHVGGPNGSVISRAQGAPSMGRSWSHRETRQLPDRVRSRTRGAARTQFPPSSSHHPPHPRQRLPPAKPSPRPADPKVWEMLPAGVSPLTGWPGKGKWWIWANRIQAGAVTNLPSYRQQMVSNMGGGVPACLTGERWALNLVLICIYFIRREAEHLFTWSTRLILIYTDWGWRGENQ